MEEHRPRWGGRTSNPHEKPEITHVESCESGRNFFRTHRECCDGQPFERSLPDGLGPWIPNDYRDLRNRILGEGAE